MNRAVTGRVQEVQTDMGKHGRQTWPHNGRGDGEK